MKRIISLALAGMLFCSGMAVTAAGGETRDDGGLVIGTDIPASHTVSLTYNDQEGSVLLKDSGEESKAVLVGRLAAPEFQITPKTGFELKTVSYNGADVTGDVTGGLLALPAMYEDGSLTVAFEKKAAVSEEPEEPGKTESQPPSASDPDPASHEPVDNSKTGESETILYVLLAAAACLPVLGTAILVGRKRGKSGE